MYNRWIDGNSIEYLFRMVAIKCLSLSSFTLKELCAIKNAKKKKNMKRRRRTNDLNWHRIPHSLESIDSVSVT